MIEVFDGDGAFSTSLCALFESPPPILTCLEDASTRRETVDTFLPFHVLIGSSPPSPPSTTKGKGQVRDLKQAFLGRQPNHLITSWKKKKGMSFLPSPSSPFLLLHYECFPPLFIYMSFSLRTMKFISMEGEFVALWVKLWILSVAGMTSLAFASYRFDVR